MPTLTEPSLLLREQSCRPVSPAAVAAVADWLDAYYEALLSYCGSGAFQNFPDPALKDSGQRYYGANLDRLRQLKAQVDPTKLFHFPQSIRPAGG